MIRRAAWLPLLALTLTACAGGAPAAAPEPVPFNPTGVYDVTVEAQGQSINGVLSIEGDAETGYSGSVDTEMGGASLSGVTVNGQEVSFSVPDAGMQGRVVFEGTTFTGGLTGAMGDALIFGTKRDGGG